MSTAIWPAHRTREASKCCAPKCVNSFATVGLGIIATSLQISSIHLTRVCLCKQAVVTVSAGESRSHKRIALVCSSRSLSYCSHVLYILNLLTLEKPFCFKAVVAYVFNASASFSFCSLRLCFIYLLSPSLQL